MSIQSLSVSFSNKAVDKGNFVLLEQEPWDPYIGMLTKLGVIAFLNKILFAGPDVTPNCGYDGSTYSKKVFAYPSSVGLPFDVKATHGKLGKPLIQNLDYTEDVQCNLKTELDLKYPAISITKVSWVGNVYDKNGALVSPHPTVTIVKNKPVVSAKVYGTLLVTYKVHRHVYSIAISPRVGALENKLQSFIYSVWDGGNTYIEMEAPTGAEEGECNNFTTGDVHFTTGDNRPKYVDPEDEYIDIDYCTGLEIT